MKKNQGSIGLILIIIGTIAILDNFLNFKLFSISRLWPLFILIPGLILQYSYVKTRKFPIILVPAGILTSLGIFFLLQTYTNWSLAGYTWPFYPMTVAIGLYQYYNFGGRPKALLVPILIITIFSLISFANIFFAWLNRRVLIAGVLVLTGIYLVSRAAFAKTENAEK